MREITSVELFEEAATKIENIDLDILREWLDHSVCLALKQYIQGIKLGLKESWADEVYQHDTADATGVSNSRALGVMTGLIQVENFLDQLSEKVTDRGEPLEDEDQSNGIQDSY